MSEWKTLKAKYEHVIKYETEQANDDRVFLLWMKWQKGYQRGKKNPARTEVCKGGLSRHDGTPTVFSSFCNCDWLAVSGKTDSVYTLRIVNPSV